VRAHLLTGLLSRGDGYCDDRNVQFALLAAALSDIYRRPAEEIRGSRWLWSVVALVIFILWASDREDIRVSLTSESFAATRITEGSEVRT
jgi:hypothetical protein